MPTLAATAHLLVTGGAGFIGSHLADRWLAGGGRVTVLDDLSAGRREHLAGALERGARLVEGSVLDEPLVDALVADCDGVAHLAAVVGVERVLARPLDTFEVGTKGGEHVLRAAARHGRPALVVSSSEVYGRSERVPFAEDDALALGSPEGPRWCYAVSKLHTETLAFALARERGLVATVARLFNTSGPRQGPESGMVVPRFVAAALADAPLVLHGDGRQRRAFCHVADAVEALARLMTTPATAGRVFNVGGGEEVEIRVLAERVRMQLRSRSPLETRPRSGARGPGDEDTDRRAADVRRIGELTGWRATRGLDVLIADVAAALGRSGRS